MELPLNLNNKYLELKEQISQRLRDFENVEKDKYFYELCFCICTPQSKAENALLVQEKLEKINFKNKYFDPSSILFEKEHYIRFHNQKAKRLLKIRDQWPEIEEILESNISDNEKRIWLFKNVNGIGMKESAHFLRNIGYKDQGILDRHILKHLVNCGVYKEIPNISSIKNYQKVERKFYTYSKKIGISMDELDLLFWASEAGLILK